MVPTVSVIHMNNGVNIFKDAVGNLPVGAFSAMVIVERVIIKCKKRVVAAGYLMGIFTGAPESTAFNLQIFCTDSETVAGCVKIAVTHQNVFYVIAGYAVVAGAEVTIFNADVFAVMKIYAVMPP